MYSSRPCRGPGRKGALTPLATTLKPRELEPFRLWRNKSSRRWTGKEKKEMNDRQREGRVWLGRHCRLRSTLHCSQAPLV